MKKGIPIDEKTRRILEQCRIENKVVYLPCQLPDKLYQSVNKVLNALGAKWSRSAGGHIFDHNIEEELKQVVKTGIYHNWKTNTDFFPTTPEVLEQLD